MPSYNVYFQVHLDPRVSKGEEEQSSLLNQEIVAAYRQLFGSCEDENSPSTLRQRIDNKENFADFFSFDEESHLYSCVMFCYAFDTPETDEDYELIQEWAQDALNPSDRELKVSRSDQGKTYYLIAEVMDIELAFEE